MASMILYTSIDCCNPFTSAQFWTAVLNKPLYPDSAPQNTEIGIDLGDGTDLLFIRLPEAKLVKNRMYLCLTPVGRQADEVQRLLTLGATVHDDRRQENGTGWAVLSNPEGNEFCVLSGTPEQQWNAAVSADDTS